MKRLLAAVGVLLALVAVVGVFYLLRDTNRIVNLGCGEIPAHTSGFGYFNSRLYPLGTVLVKESEPGRGIAVLGYAAGLNPTGMPGGGGRDRKLALKAQVQGTVPWADAGTRSEIEQAASRVATFTAHNARGWSLPGVEDEINRADLRSRIRLHLQQRHPVAIITSVLIADSLGITTTGEAAASGVNLGTFGRNRVAATFSCGRTDQFKGKDIPIAFDVTEIEDPGPRSQLRTRTATPGAWGVTP